MTRARFWLLTFLIAALLILTVALGTAYRLILGSRITISPGSVVEVVLNSPLNEVPSNDLFSQFLEGNPLSLWELRETFDYASRDEAVSAVYLEVHPLLLSWSGVEEVRGYIQRFQRSGKPVHVYLALDMLRDVELYLISAADFITMNPAAMLAADGLAAELTFYKGAMEKLGIKPQFIQFKEFKSAESFTREAMAPQIREMYRSILEDISGRLAEAVVGEREIPRDRFEQLVAEGVAPAQRALNEGLVDSLGYRSEVRDRLTQLVPGDHPYQGVPARRYLEARRERFRTRGGSKVALMHAAGTITSGNSASSLQIMGGVALASRLREVRENEELQGVLLWVNSPGGSAVGSDMVWKEVQRLREASKPVVVAMNGVAGSGGYYISMAADRIVSQPSTITGSIGVIFGKFDLEPLYNWLGITIDRVQTAPNASTLSMTESLSPEQLERVESSMEVVYDRFVELAAAGRGLSVEAMEAMARGRIYTGAQAREIGLVDEIGGIETALGEMKEALNLGEGQEIEVLLYPPPKSLWERIAEGSLLDGLRPPSPGQWLKEQVPLLSQPRLWLLMPDARID